MKFLSKSQHNHNATHFTRYKKNPIIKPDKNHLWQQRGTYNAAAIYEDGKVHIVYRAQAPDGTSSLGYASSWDGLHIDENLDEPIYVPRKNFELKTSSFGNSGCEDPRITKIGDRFYMAYTAYDNANPPHVALTSIAVSDFLNKNWSWDDPKLITPPSMEDKDACITQNTHGDGYLAFHRLQNDIWLDFLPNLDFANERFLSGSPIAKARFDKWDNVKIGLASPPIETENGWLLFYHAISDPGFVYKIGALLLDYHDPSVILARSNHPLLEPERKYEIEGQVPNVVFSCGTVVIDDVVYLYYGGADTVIGVATMPLTNILQALTKL